MRILYARVKVIGQRKSAQPQQRTVRHDLILKIGGVCLPHSNWQCPRGQLLEVGFNCENLKNKCSS